MQAEDLIKGEATDEHDPLSIADLRSSPGQQN